ncbi:pilus assembly protein PilP [Photobacterium sp. SDRW27]|uniref:pilus assembly protein PilP n=1 Tax=Photobacterium obscurum TaxID=2829490 RepID=UPI0022438E09|nr:pilus assembly protein PilP [Photobacterium obscurum]MCW8329641.1 pilus assembly protein PilP [Photobacterium obscurum]
MKMVWLIAPVCMLMLGCRANEDSIQGFIGQAHDEALAEVAPLQEQYKFVADEFVMTSPRVPFIRPRPELAESEPETAKACWQPDVRQVRGPLESYPLVQLSMKGVLGDGNQLWALIYTPEGKLVKIREGYYLGLNHGRVLQVSPKSIEIEEILPDGVGCWLKRPIKLTLVTTDSAV